MDYDQYRLKNFYDVKKRSGVKSKQSQRPISRHVPNSNRFDTYTDVNDYDPQIVTRPQPSNTLIFNEHVPINQTTKPSAPEYNHQDNNDQVLTKDSLAKVKDKTALYVTSLIIFCFAIVILSCEIIGGGIILNELKSVFNKNYDCSYYLVVLAPFDSKTDAEAQSLKIKEKMGAGYIYAKDSKYYVAIATYLDKKSAESVSNKNQDSHVLEIVVNKPLYGSLNQKEYEFIVHANEKIKYFISLIYEASLHQEISNLVAMATNIRNSVLAFKEEILVSGIEKGLRDSLIKRINPLFDYLEITVLQQDHQKISHSIRYAACLGVDILADTALD